MSLKDNVDEVLRKIGRNMILFQQLEQLLKFVVANGSLSGFTSQLADIKAKHCLRGYELKAWSHNIQANHSCD
jgi:hypothetical protein